MKKFICAVLALVMIFALVACGGTEVEETKAPETKAPEATKAPEETKAPEKEEETPDYASMTIEELKEVLETVEDGKLTIATSPDFAPYEFYALDEAGKPTLAGFDIALAQYVADFIGLELEVIPMDFDGVLLELTNKTVDLGVAGLSPDPDRMDAMDFSDIYYEGGQSFVTVKDKLSEFPSLETANDAKFSIGAQTGSIQFDLATENTPDAEIIQLAKVTDIIMELLTGKLDGAFIETVVAESYSVNYPDLAIAHDVPYDVAGSALGISKGNEALAAAVNLAIAAAIEDGSMAKFVSEANELASGDIHEGLLDTAA